MIPIAKPLIGREEVRGVIDELPSGTVVEDPKAKEFEKPFANYRGSRSVRACCRNGRIPVTTGEDGTSAQSVATAAIESFQSRPMGKIAPPVGETAPAVG